MKKSLIFCTLPLLLSLISGCNSNSQGNDEVITKKKLTILADDAISYVPLNSEYLPGESVTFQITSLKLSSQEYKVYLNDEALVGMTETTYIFTMPNKDSTLKVELKNITKKINFEDSDKFNVSVKDNLSEASINQEVFFNFEIKNEYVNDINLKAIEAYYYVQDVKTNFNLTINSISDYKYSFIMPNYDVYLKPVYETIQKYKVTLKETDNIKIKLINNKTDYQEFEKVTFTLEIKNEARLKEVVAIDEEGSNLPVLYENNEYSFYIGNKNVTIEVKEKSNELYLVTSIVKPKYGTVSFVDGKTEYYEGDLVSFKITTSAGYKVKGCNLYDISLESVATTVRYDSSTDTYYFTMIDQDLYLDAEFSQIYVINVNKPETLELTYVEEKSYYVGGEKVEFTVKSIDTNFAFDSLSITYYNGSSDIKVDYNVKDGVYSFSMPTFNVTITLNDREVSAPSSNPFNDVSKFQATVKETYYDEWDDYYTTTLTFNLTFDFNGDGTFTYTAYYVEAKETKKVFDHYTFTYNEDTLCLNMALGFSQDVKKDYFKAIKDSDGNVNSFKALMDIDPHNGIYTIKTNTIFTKI